MDQQEKQEQQEAANQETTRQFANSQSWKLVKDSLIRKIMDLDSVSATFEALQKKGILLDEIKELLCVNAKAVNIIVDWLNEIETAAGGRGNTMAEMKEKKGEEIIIKLPD